MEILDLNFENWYTLVLKVNWLSIIIVIVGVVAIVYLWNICPKYVFKKNIMVNEVTLGIGSNTVALKYNKKDQEIAYKLWVELGTRKIGLMFEPEYDVLTEVYDSWYAFFSISRELLKEIPAERLQYSSQLITLTENVLNKGLRPHLTMWQAKYRKWYASNEEKYDEKTPQEIQKKFPQYEELEKDLIETNKRMIEYKELMEKIAFNK